MACVCVPSSLKAQPFLSSQQNLREPLFRSRGCVPIHVTLCTHSRWCVPSMLHFLFTKEGVCPHMSQFAPTVEGVCHPCYTLHIIQRAWGIPWNPFIDLGMVCVPGFAVSVWNILWSKEGKKVFLGVPPCSCLLVDWTRHAIKHGGIESASHCHCVKPARDLVSAIRRMKQFHKFLPVYRVFQVQSSWHIPLHLWAGQRPLWAWSGLNASQKPNRRD